MSIRTPETARDYLIDGLRDAHAMESQAISMTTTQADRLKHYPDIERRVREHIRETEGQRDRLERCLDKLGSSASTLKDATMKLAANAQMAFHAMTEDEVVKNCLASYAFEHFEIISYKALIETAKIADQPDIAAACQQNLAEEEAMAAWIGEHLPDAVRKYLARTSVDVEAKR
jgi:ferritin-like metal-binding protein YciE